MSQAMHGSLSVNGEAGAVLVDGPGVAITLTPQEAVIAADALSIAAGRATSERLASAGMTDAPSPDA